MGTVRKIQRLSVIWILTLVLMPLVAVSSPHNRAPSPATPTPQQTQDEGPDIDENNLVLSNPRTIIKRKIEIYYPYRTSFSPRLGIFGDSERVGNGEIDYLIGCNFLVKSRKSPQIEVGADVTSETSGYVHVSLRKIFFQNNVMRPFLKGGIANRAQGDEGLATFANKDNYLALASVGFEDYLTDPMSVRIELQAMVGTAFSNVSLTLGYSWGW